MIGLGTVLYGGAALSVLCWVYVSTYLEKRRMLLEDYRSGRLLAQSVVRLLARLHRLAVRLDRGLWQSLGLHESDVRAILGLTDYKRTGGGMNIEKATTYREPPAKNVVSANPFLALAKDAPEHLVHHPKSKESR